MIRRRSRRRPAASLHLESLEERTLLDGSTATVLYHPEAILRLNNPLPGPLPLTAPPPGGSQGGGGGRLGPIPTNVLVNDPNEDGNSRNDTQSETALVLGANNDLIAAYNDSFFANANPRQFTGFSVSTDGGDSFTDKGHLPIVAGGDLGDPVLVRDNVSGRVYFASLSFNSNQLNIYHSDNDGVTFSNPVNGAPGHPGANLDKEWLAVDNFAGAGQGNVYMVLRDFGSGNGVFLTRSTDQGQTFTSNWVQLVAAGGGNVQGPFVAVGPDHTVYAFWYDHTTGQAAIKMRKSTDQGQTFAPAVTVTTLRVTAENGDLGLGGFRSNAFPQAAVNAANGDLYVTFNDKGSPDRADVFFTQSGDGGATWSTPVKVNDDTTTHDHWQPALAVTPGGAKVGIFWYDRRNDPGNNRIDRFGAIGDVVGHSVTFEPNFQVTDVSFPPAFRNDPAVNPVYMGDYDTVVASNTAFYTTWGDNRSPSLGHAGNEADVRFAKIPVVVAGPAVISSSPTGDLFGAVGSVRVTFDEPIDATTFTPAQVDSFTAPDGSAVPITAVTPVDGSNETQFDITFPTQLTLGQYTLVIGPNILDQSGNPMDQDGNGIPGEVPGDEFTTSFTIHGPQIIAATPADGGVFQPGQVSSFRVTFNEPMDPATFGAGAVTLTGPAGVVPAAGVNPVDGSGDTQFDISFGPVGTTGVYTLKVGPHIQDLTGHEMDQDGNFIPGEDPGDAFFTSFTVLGPRITASFPVNGSDTFPLDHIRVTFSEPMDPATFTPDKIASFVGPNGPVPVTDVQPVAGSNNTRFDILFDAQTDPGTYTMVIGPDIRDPFGNEMDQNGNLIPGEIPGDQYTARVNVASGLTPLGPDGFGYTAAGFPASDQDILNKLGTFTIITAADDVSLPVNLGTNTFSFYGRTYTGNNQLFVSSNGLITFGSANSASVNTDLTTSPPQAAFAVLWNDWIKDTNDPTGPMVVGKFTAVDGNGLPHRLVIEWNQVRHFGNFQGRLTFEAVLQLNTGDTPGQFGVNFLNLQSGDRFAEGAGSTVGIKDAGTQGANRLLVNFSGTSPFVGTSQAIIFATGDGPAVAPLGSARLEPATLPSPAAVAEPERPSLPVSNPSAVAPMASAIAESGGDVSPLVAAALGADEVAEAAGLGDPLA